MGIFDLLLNKKKTESATALPTLPQEIFQAATLEFQDMIAPPALKVEPKSLNLGGKIARTYFVISYPRFLGES
ncbi:MAG TPA: hypothetical protein PK950_00900, partial [Candidatus Paceibacterota bacterium]|nr:hypothetical protein [Candidatus Paceibacterota bacterium]